MRKSNTSETFYSTLKVPQLKQLLIVTRGSKLVAVYFCSPDFATAKKRLLENYPAAKKQASPPQKIANELLSYFTKKNPSFFGLSLLLEGTTFQKQVWEMTAKIPFGKVLTYRELASKIKKPGAARAVGNALGKNPIPIIIPCHRVVAAQGKIGGFSGGPGIKEKLLIHEGVILL